MYKIGIVLFDDYTDVDFFLMYDLLGRVTNSWIVSILGTKSSHRSHLGMSVKTNGHISEVTNQDVVLITSGKLGIPAALQDSEFMSAAYSHDVDHSFSPKPITCSHLSRSLFLVTLR